MVNATTSTEKKVTASSSGAEKKVEAAAKKAEKKAEVSKDKEEGAAEEGEADAGPSAAAPPKTELKKTAVQLTPEAFMEAAKTYECRIMDGEEQVASYTMAPKLNGTGSFGWNANQQVKINVAGEDLTVGMNCNATIWGSKPKGKKK